MYFSLLLSPGLYFNFAFMLKPVNGQERNIVSSARSSHHIDLAAVLGHATQPGFLETEPLFNHSERMLKLGAQV